MDGITYLIFSLIGIVVSIVFLFFKKLRIIGLFLLLICIVGIGVGVNEIGNKCSTFNYYGGPTPEETYECDSIQTLFSNLVEENDLEKNNSYLKTKIEQIYSKKAYNRLKTKERNSLKNLSIINELNLKLEKSFNRTLKLDRKSFEIDLINENEFNSNVNWKIKTLILDKIDSNLFNCSGYFYTDSAIISYEGIVDNNLNTIYFDNLKFKSLRYKKFEEGDCENLEFDDNPCSFISLDPDLKRRYFYWIQFYPNFERFSKLSESKNLKKTKIKFEGKVYPIYVFKNSTYKDLFFKSKMKF
jgi:hypothetical protein